MKLKNMGKTGLKVSVICLGTMTFGTQVKEADAIGLIHSGMDNGINFLDTAPVYNSSLAEEIVGKAIKGSRHDYVVATKAGPPAKIIPGVPPGPNETGLSRKSIFRQIEGSLKRLQTDYIDIYYVHEPDHNTPLEETLDTLNDLVRQGKVRYLGCSNFAAWQTAQALRVSERRRLAGFNCVQPPYNLLTRDIEMELLPFCLDEGLGVCVYNPLAGEMLTGRHEFGKPPAEGRFTLPVLGPGYLKRYWSETNFNAVEKLKVLAAEHRVTLPQFALAWILHNPAITSVLSGTISQVQLQENMASVDIQLTTEEFHACDEVWSMFKIPRYHYAHLPGIPLK
ncbi:MAG: aldo/keto reductase [Dehalococcoidales bacterium]|nr:aldo/keto reductase [Dehalococcoidales bacterium]